MRLPILLEHSAFLAIDKPAGLSAHNDSTNESSVLSLLGKEHFLVHRLDKETSGVLLIAKSKLAAAELASQFQLHQTEKVYYAILRGQILEKNLIWNWPISDKGEGRKNPQGLLKDRVSANTEVAIENQNKYFSLAKIIIKTGRQHQIRKHAAISKHAIVGDSRYGDPKYNKKISDLYKLNRMFLHSAKLVFHYQKKEYVIDAPLPTDFSVLIS